MTSLVQMEGIRKSFFGRPVNQDIDFEVRPGEIHALLGENGAGKTTLMNILTGVYLPDAGRIRFQGRDVAFRFPGEALAAGLGMVHQNFSLIGKLTVLENVILGLPSNRRWLHLDERTRFITRYAREYAFDLDMSALVERLPIGLRQRVEILKMLVREVRVLIVDEPTAVLTKREADNLIEILKKIAAAGRGVVFISHKMKEVLQVADRITVLRKGRKVETVGREGVTAGDLARMMVGREFETTVRKKPGVAAEELLDVDDLRVESDDGLPAVRALSFSVRRGEIVGVAGVSGNGQRELAEALAGTRAVQGGHIHFKKREITHASARERIDMGLSYIPPDRVNVGVAGPMSIWENLGMKVYRKKEFRKGPFLSPRALRRYAERIIEKYDVAHPGLDFPALLLSGGNLQKLIIGREMEQVSDLYLCMYPTRGLDVGATEFVRRALLDLRAAGKCVLLLSGDLDELFELSDRILVMYEGRFSGRLEPAEYDVERAGLLMSGARAEDVAHAEREKG